MALTAADRLLGENSDYSSWPDLQARFGPKLLAFIRRQTNPVVAEDIYQETLLSIHNSLGKFQPRQFESWAFRIARNSVVDHYRALGRAREVPSGISESAGEGEAWLPLGATDDLHQEAFGVELARLLGAHEGRPMAQRRWLVLALTELGCPDDEIARLLKINLSNLRKDRHVARRALVEELSTAVQDRRRHGEDLTGIHAVAAKYVPVRGRTSGAAGSQLSPR